MITFDPRQQAADRLIRPLREGKPELGWSGDPFLVLVFERLTQRWELWRNEPAPGQPDRHVLISKGPVGQDINEDAINLLIRQLVRMDTTRAGNSAEAISDMVDRENARLERQRDQQAVDATGEALAKFYHEAGRALGVTKTTFAT